MEYEKPRILNRVGIQIVSNRPDYLSVLLSSLLRQTFTKWDLFLAIPFKPNHLIANILTRMEFEGHRTVIINTNETGIGKLRNMVLEIDDCEFGLRIDDDSFCEPGYIQRLYSCITSVKDAGVVGGIVPFMFQAKNYQPLPQNPNTVDKDGNISDHCVFFFNRVTTEPIECDHIRSSFMYRNDIAKKVKFPEIYDSLCGFREETDFCLRVKAAGFKVLFIPEAVCWHLLANYGGLRPGWDKIKEDGAKKADMIFREEVKKLKSNTKN
jgi:GT2 family glycosyltransferase